MRTSSKLLELVRSNRGGALVMTALAMPLLIGSAGLATDTVQWTLWKRQLQRAADSGALAGAYARAQDKSVSATVQADLAKDGEIAFTSTLIENAPSTGAYAGDPTAVRVVLASTRALPFSSLFLAEPPAIIAEATAAMVSNGNHCVVSLEDTTATGITMLGNTTVTLGCGMATNAIGANAVTADGSAEVRATPITAVGGVPASDAYEEPTVLQPYSMPQPDPFEELEDPVLPSHCESRVSVSPSQTRTLEPKCYRGFDFKGTVHLEPGIYYINGDSVTISSQATVIGHGVTIVLTSSNPVSNPASIATVNINAGATLDLTAPSTGEYAGILIYQDRRAQQSNGSNKINGNAHSKIQGAIYMPGQAIEFTGTTSMDTECVQLVGRRVIFSGNSTITNNCPVGSGAHNFIGSRIQLVG